MTIFFLVYCLLIKSNLDIKINNNDNIKVFNNFAESLIMANEDILKKGFWEIITKNNLDNNKLKICEPENGFKQSFPINSLFGFLNNIEEFCVSYEIIKYCKLCKKIDNNIITIHTLIPVSLSEIIEMDIKTKFYL